MAEWKHALRAYPHLLRASFAASVAYRVAFLIVLVSTTMPLVMLALWLEVTRTSPVDGFTARRFTVYYLTSIIVRIATGCWVVYDVTNELRLGTLNYRLLRPLHPLLAYSAENLAEAPMRALVCAPVLFVLIGPLHADICHDPVLWAAFLPAVFGAWLLAFFSTALIGMLAFWFDKAMSVFYAWTAVTAVLSGYIVPLDLLPGPVRAFAHVAPFRFLLSFPVEIVAGRLERRQALLLLALQWTYLGLGFFAARLVWRRGLRRHGAFGD
ncbi:MAG TPA: ABC-2 family transporter protein [Myxococcales bacterium]|jgi:ABC-2 type transport system permease protein